jgi:outer membrane receptor protein involved in Fe transport
MQLMYRRNSLFVAIATTLLGGVGQSAFAQEASKPNLGLEEIIVTATKQEETVSNVGASIIAVSSKQIDELGYRSMASLVQSTPNVNVYEGSTGTKLTVRGVGTPPTGGASASVATFIDGVYQGNSSQTNNILVDMERVEILRGPQGTLFGKNSIAGVFNLITARPTQDFEALIDLRAGNYDSVEGTAVVSGGLTDDISGRMMVYRQKTGDYLDNTFEGNDAGGGSKEAFRGSLNWNISDNTSVWVKAQHDHVQRNAATTQLIGLDPADAAHLNSIDPSILPRIDTKLNDKMATGFGDYYGNPTGLNPDTSLVTSRDTFAAILTHTFDNEYELTATAGWDRNRVNNRGNTSQDYPLVTVYLDTKSTYQTSNLEMRLSSPTDDRFRFTVGGYAEKSKYGIDSGNGYLNFAAPLQAGGPATTTLINGILADAGVPTGLLASDEALSPALIMSLGTPYGRNRTTSLALYGQATYDFTDELSLTLGLRAAQDEIEQDKNFDTRTDLNGNSLFSTESFAGLVPVPGLGIEDAYAATAQGLAGAIGIGIPGMPNFNDTHKDRALLPAGKFEYRPSPDELYYASIQSGYKNGGFATDGLGYPNEFEKEKSIAYELGGKISVADGRGQINGAVFRTDFKDLQVAIIDPLSGGVLFTNAAKAYTQGLELGGRWRFTEELTGSLNYAYLQSRYNSFENGPRTISMSIADPLSTQPQDLSHKPLMYAPRNAGSAALDYVQPLNDVFDLQATVSVAVTDDSYSELSNSDELKAHSSTIVDATVALVDTVDLWRVALIGQNLTDDRNLIYGTSGSLVNKGTYFGQMRQPMTYWLQVQKRFK